MKTSGYVAASLFAVLTLGSTTAAASEPRTKDGLQLVLGAGVAYASAGVSVDPEPSPAPDTSLSGIGFAGLLMIGGTLGDGLAVGGANWGATFPSPTVSVDGNESDADGSFSPNLLGPYVDYYLDPSGGLHFTAIAGIATADDGNDATGLATGFGLGVGAGYDVWIGDEWSLGGLLRLQYSALSADFDDSDASVSYSTIIPALQLTVSHH